MRTNTLPMAATAMLLALMPLAARAVDTADTSFLHEPDIGAERIVFVYADDLWTAKPDGSDVRRLTAHPGSESNPHFSPDGRSIAFTGSYDGNVDAFIIPASGGEPTRLTAHPGEDVVRGFAPDGSVLFASQRQVFTGRFAQFFTVGTAGGFPKRLPVPNGDRAAYSPDGKSLAYTPIGERFRQWKNYRGGTASRIWILTFDGLGVEQVPQPEGRCNDTYPMWVGDAVYFLSDRAGEFNLFAFDRDSKRVTQLTRHDDFPVESASAGAGKIIYEQAGHLFVFDPGAKRSTRLTIGVASDLPETRGRLVSGAKYIRGADISPSGKRAVFEFRGEIVTVPAKKGDVRNLTQTTGAHERSPIWSPDGKSIAYFSDKSGEYALMIEPQDNQGEPKSYSLQGAGFYERPAWSPDSKKIAFIDNSRTLSWIDLDSGKVTKVDSEPIYGPENTLNASWSPDSKWIAYTLTNRAYFQTLYLYSLDDGKSRKLTDGLAEVAEPIFDAGGKYLYFLASTDAGPVKQWFDQSNADMQATHSLFIATLDKKTPNPLLKESDEESDEKPKSEGKKESGEAGDKGKDDDKGKKEEEKPKPVVVDLDGIEARILPLPIPSGNLSNLIPGSEGQIYYIRRVGMVPGRSGEAFAGTPSLARFELKTREEETLAEKVDGFRLSADKKKLLYRSKEAWGIADAGKFTVGKDTLPVGSISVRVTPRDEWPQIFQEAWRINRDYFYATNYHGADWPMLRTRYAAMLPEVPTRDDLNRVIRMLLSELAVGHSYLGGGDRLYEPKTIPVGLLGADFEVADGRYRFRKVYGGLNWDPQLKAPLKAPGVDAKEGEYLLAVDGQDLKDDTEVYRLFEDKVGRRVELKVGPKPDGTDARTVTVEPVGNEGGLRNRDWVEGNLKKVRERTGGKVAYVYVPNTAEMGHAYFKRYFFPQVGADAIIVDERFNGGGSVADYYIDLLRRPQVSYWAMRHGDVLRTPGAAIPGPKVMIIDETAGSGGDLLPWMFRKFDLGKLVGRRTWGGLVGILGFPVLMDGGRVTAPDLAIFTEDGWVVENEGVPPDIEVEQSPAEVARGKDPQLDKAIEVVLEELRKSPPKTIERPPFPTRVRRAREEVTH
jgi:tricorn protease